MSLATVLIPVGIAGVCVASEYLRASNSKWHLLAQKFRNGDAPPNGWRGCRFVQIEIVEGNVFRRTGYGHGFPKSSLDFAWAKAFPMVSASVNPAGLYLKRRPWNFLHPQILIPWSCFTSVQNISATQHVTSSVNRQLEFRGTPLPVKIPNPVAGVMDTLVGDVVELRLADPSLRINLPASSVPNWEQYAAAKPTAPSRQPSSSPVGAR